MSMFSTISASSASSRATVCSNGYMFTHTRSTGSTPCSAASRRCASSSRRASSPAYSRGTSVFTRPSMISGKPVKSSIARTAIPAPASSRAVPPVEMTSTPSSSSPRAKSTTPRLSLTDSSARRTRTSPGCARSIPAARSVVGPPSESIWLSLSLACPLRRQIYERPARIGRVGPQRPVRVQAHRVGQQLVLERPQRLQHLVGVARARQLKRTLQDHRTGVHALVDEVNGHAEHLHAVRERLLDRTEPGERREQGGVHVDHRPGKAGQELRREQLHVSRQHDQSRRAL